MGAAGTADEDLLQAVLEPRKPGALQKIADACEAGADPNAVCPAMDCMTARMREGTTLLTHAIDAWESKAVRKLLECGADPNRADRHGWTPWMVSTLVDESKRRKIQDSLSEFGADKKGEHIGDLARAIFDGDTGKAASLIQSDQDLEILKTFRVDLLGHQVTTGNTSMLQMLVERGMTPSTTNLLNTVRQRNLEALDVLLRHGMPPERPDENETPLMTAASIGDLAIVERLVEAGADVNRCSDEEGEWTPSFYARQAGHTEVADWLAARMDPAVVQRHEAMRDKRNAKFALLYERATAGEGLSTKDLVAVLSRWDGQFGVTVEDAAPDRVAVRLTKTPGNLEEFVQEVLDLCPDAIDFEAELRKEMAENRKLVLWWD